MLGGVFIGVLSALPIVNVANYCCCLWILGGGILSAHLLQQNEPGSARAARAAIAGLMAGVVGAFTWLILTIAFDALLAPLQERLVDVVIANARDMPPDVRAMFDSLRNGAGPVRFLVGFVFQLFAGMTFSTIGALIGFAWLRPDQTPEVS